MAIMLKYDGINGESKVKGFEKYTALTSFETGVGRRVASAAGASTRQGSTANISEVIVKKETDGTTVRYFEEALCGKLDKTVSISFVRTGAAQSEEYLNFKMEQCGVSGLSFKASGGDLSRPEETLHLNFVKLTVKYNPIGDDLTGSPASYGWNLATSAKL